MTKEEFFKQLKNNYDNSIAIMEKKNGDYAGDFDPFKNFRKCESFGVTTAKGMLVRITDKLSRIENLLDKPPEVVEESLSDTLTDLMSYTNILKTWIDNENMFNKKEKV